MKISFKITAVTLFILLFVGCAQKKVDPLSLAITEADKEQTEYPPSKDELVLPRNDLVLLVEEKGVGITDERLKPIQTTIKDIFKKAANFTIVPEDKISSELEKPEYREFRPNNIVDSIQFARKLDGTFLALQKVYIESSAIEKGIDTYVAKIDLTLFVTSSRELIFKKSFLYYSTDTLEFKEELKNTVETYLPLRGYIVETRGNHQVAKITLGRSVGISAGRELLVRNRIVKGSIGGSSQQLGLQTKVISFSREAVARVKVIQVMENEAWIEIDENDRNKIKLGQVVFTLPEE